MNNYPQRKNWLFPIEEAPVLAPVIRNGVAGHVPVPRKKALVAADRTKTEGTPVNSPSP